jgi:hypothetical protein
LIEGILTEGILIDGRLIDGRLIDGRLIAGRSDREMRWPSPPLTWKSQAAKPIAVRIKIMQTTSSQGKPFLPPTLLIFSNGLRRKPGSRPRVDLFLEIVPFSSSKSGIS